MKVRVASGARKHGITTARIRAALRNAELVSVDGDKAGYIGVDDQGEELELVIAPDDREPGPDAFTVIHAMPTRWRDDERPIPAAIRR